MLSPIISQLAASTSHHINTIRYNNKYTTWFICHRLSTIFNVWFGISPSYVVESTAHSYIEYNLFTGDKWHNATHCDIVPIMLFAKVEREKSLHRCRSDFRGENTYICISHTTHPEKHVATEICLLVTLESFDFLMKLLLEM